MIRYVCNDCDEEVRPDNSCGCDLPAATPAMYRIEIYRPHPDNPDDFERGAWESGGSGMMLVRLGSDLRTCRPGTFALIIEVNGDTETLLERWRVDAQGRVLRARYSVLEEEREQTP